MALGVRAAQLGRNKNCGMYILITMVCAAMFLGVKAIEYSHKWDMGIFPGSGFNLTYTHPEPMDIGGLKVSKYLVWISMIPAALLIGFIVASVVGWKSQAIMALRATPRLLIPILETFSWSR